MPNEFQVEKQYQKRDGNGSFWVQGVLRCDEDLQDISNQMDERLISSVDPRIEWDEEAPDGFEYVDWSFCLTNEELEKLDPPLYRIDTDTLLDVAGEMLETLQEISADCRQWLEKGCNVAADEMIRCIAEQVDRRIREVHEAAGGESC